MDTYRNTLLEVSFIDGSLVEGGVVVIYPYFIIIWVNYIRPVMGPHYNPC